MLKARVIKSNSCKNCKAYLRILKNQKYDVEIYDGDAEENQDELDAWKVNAFPVVQIIDVKPDGSKEKVWQFPYRTGGWAPRMIRGKIAELERKRGKKDDN